MDRLKRHASDGTQNLFKRLIFCSRLVFQRCDYGVNENGAGMDTEKQEGNVDKVAYQKPYIMRVCKRLLDEVRSFYQNCRKRQNHVYIFAPMFVMSLNYCL